MNTNLFLGCGDETRWRRFYYRRLPRKFGPLDGEIYTVFDSAERHGFTPQP